MTRIRAGIGLGLGCALIPGIAAAQPFTITLEVIPGTVADGNATVTVEAFIRNDGPDFEILAYQIDLPCLLQPLPGGTGELRAQPVSGCLSNADCPTGAACLSGSAPRSCNSTAVPNMSNAASGSVPWVFAAVAPNDATEGCGGSGCNGGLKPANLAGCRFAGTPGVGEPPYILPGGGARRFLGHVRYRVSTCATGTFNVPFEVFNNPCNNSDLTRLVNKSNQCINGLVLTPTSISVPFGRCCVAGEPCQDANSVCCAARPGSSFELSATCLDGCPCEETADCFDDNSCTDDECVNEVCRHDPNSLPCDDGLNCTVGDFCKSGFCLSGAPICGENQICDPAFGRCVPVDCPEDTLFEIYPPDGVVDARQPWPPGMQMTVSGIGDANNPIRVGLVTTGAPAHCFELCETEMDPKLGPNEIVDVVEVIPGEYEIHLLRPISPLAVTGIRYFQGGSVSFVSHPANVNGNPTADSGDVSALLGSLDSEEPPLGLFSVDINHSNEADAMDIVRLIDLLQASAVYPPYQGTTLPVSDECP